MKLGKHVIQAKSVNRAGSRTMIGQNICNIMMFADLVDKNDRFAIISTGEKVVKFSNASQIQLI